MPPAARRNKNWLQITIPLVILGLILLVFFKKNDGEPNDPPKQHPAGPGTYLFCFWNVENLFDDNFDERTGRGDPEYDTWYSKDPDMLKLKLDRLSDALLELNGGKGPDILANCEVESERANEMLRQALNAKLKDKSLHYSQPVFKGVSGGRHIAPGIITRLEVDRNRTQVLNERLRILEVHLKAAGQDLVVLASHWTSRVTEEGIDKGRRKYADLLYGRFKAMYLSNPQVDLIICGDFNDTPSDPSVTESLQATGDRKAVLRSGGEDPLLFNLSANRNAKQFGTHYFEGKLFLYDQLVVSPGMLDNRGWSCDPDSLKTINSLAKPGDSTHKPWSFGREKHKGVRGTSDHFPVTVQLKVVEKPDSP